MQKEKAHLPLSPPWASRRRPGGGSGPPRHPHVSFSKRREGGSVAHQPEREKQEGTAGGGAEAGPGNSRAGPLPSPECEKPGSGWGQQPPPLAASQSKRKRPSHWPRRGCAPARGNWSYKARPGGAGDGNGRRESSCGASRARKGLLQRSGKKSSISTVAPPPPARFLRVGGDPRARGSAEAGSAGTHVRVPLLGRRSQCG